MAKANAKAILSKLLGKKVVFEAKFDRGDEARLRALAEAQQGLIVDEVAADTNFLVLPDLSKGKGVQKKVQSLNAKGASIQVVDADAFKLIVEPTADEMLALIRQGKSAAGIWEKVSGARFHFHSYHFRSGHFTPRFTFTGEKLDGLDLSGFYFNEIAFDQCSFTGAQLNDTRFVSAKACDFSGAKADDAEFGDADQSRFVKASLKKAEFHGPISGADFSGADLQEASFSRYVYGASSPQQLNMAGCVFARGSLKSAKLDHISLDQPDFEGADLTGAALCECHFKTPNFHKAVLRDSTLVACNLSHANLTGTDCTGANLADADLTGAQFDQANLSNCNLRGAKLGGANLAKAINYNPSAQAAGSAGPAVTELETLAGQAKRIDIKFLVRQESTGDEMEVGLNSAGLRWGGGLHLPYDFPAARSLHHKPGRTFSGAMLDLANVLVNRKVRYETVDVSSTKSPKGGKELRELVLNAIAEAFAQPLPAADDLATATKAFRDQSSEQRAADKERREAAKKLAEKQKVTEKKQIAKKIAKEVGKVVDIASFLKALELRADKSKIDKATKMLKADKFKLFNDIGEEHMAGVVKSQSDPDLVYACRIESSGQYACCTQNLNICGGLRGSPCKHLLVLIIGLVKAGELDPATIDTWVAKTHDTKPELNKETMGEIFIRYKGAEAGEVDWRPTETVPEDYYAL